jgi:hypothetical protein
MVNLAYTPKEIKEEKAEYSTIVNDVPKYPYGLSICLNEETLSKLGKTINDFQVNSTITIPCTLLVTGVSSRKNSSGAEEQEVSATITDMDIPDAQGKDPAATMYDKPAK